MRFYSIFLFCAAFQAASATPISIPNDIHVVVHNLPTSSRQTQLLEPRGKHYQHKQSHKHVPVVAPKITFQKGIGAESLDKQLGQLKLRGKKKQVVESYRKKLKTWQNPDTAPPPSFAHLPGNKKGGERYLKAVIKDQKANSHLAYHHLNKLRLHGKKRKAVEKYHRKLVGDHVKDIHAAPSSESSIKNLAHGTGSVDPKIHISVKIKNERGDIIGAPRHGNANRIDPIHHVYTNKENPKDGYASLPIEYKKALDKKARREGKKTGRA
jgi:hypothetical protein